MKTSTYLMIIVLLAGFVFVGSGGAMAQSHKETTTLYTPTIDVGLEQNKGLQCTAVNVDKVVREITIEIIAFDGRVVAEREPQSIEPLHVAPLGISIDQPLHFCRITVRGPKRSVRGGMCILDFFTGGCTAPPVPAE
jgi:hypothetical protein